MNRFVTGTMVALASAAILGGCRGQISDKPPIHPMLNMDNVRRYDAQEPSQFWADGRSSRMPVEGTVAVGQLYEDTVLYEGVDSSGAFVSTLPDGIKLDQALLDRGQDRYDIYCAICHDRAGSGNGIVKQRGFVPPPDFSQDRVREFPVGQITNVIAKGVRTMPAYAAQIPAEDRWAIAAYVRVLQISQGASLDQVPADVAGKQGWK